MIYSPADSTDIVAAMHAVLGSNNGYAFVGFNATVAQALEQAGFVVLLTKNLHGRPEYKAFTRAAQAALRSGEGESTYKSFSLSTGAEEPDMEAAILAQNSRLTEE